MPAPSARARTAPPLQRGSMTPAPWFGFWRGLLFALWPGLRWNGAERFDRAWHGAARQRRRVLLALVAVMVGAALTLRIDTGPYNPDAWWWSTTVLMTLLFAWVGVGCATAVMGAWSLWRGDPHAPKLRGPRGPIDAGVRTALVMPICNEDIAEVFAGLRATCESLAATGQQQRFDVFVLSDTKDPALQQAEVRAFERVRAMLAQSASGLALFYRWRKRRTKRKAGNVADFCRRWGRNYRYMIVLDADSTMSGDTLGDLVRLMEQHPRAGIIQTLPQVANPATLHARAQHFAGRVTGRLFALGMAWWQLGDAHYWGHNAILRVDAFMRHCALAKLPGRGGLAGEILSHDFVEAALMGRRGYEVWLVPDLGGSWEQSPSNLLDELQRDRRWCQGNLQNLRLVAEPGWRPAHRMMFSVGALSYLVAPLWLLFMVLGLGGASLLGRDLSLWLLTLTLLILPRLMGVVVIAARGEAAAFGGITRLSIGAVIELLMSTIQAPIRMLAHCLFVLGALTGLKLEWKSPPRGGEAVSWRDATRRMGSLTMLPLVASLGLLRLRAAFVAMVPMMLPLSLAVPFTVITGHPRAGRAVARLGLLRTPEEWRPTRELVRASESHSFIDLVPVPQAPPQPALVWARPRRALRLASASVMMGVAALAMTVPQSGIAPELSPSLRAESDMALAWRAEQEMVAYWTEPMLPLIGEAPVRKRVVAREKPARMIDDALRQRALEAVRMLATQPPPV
ncbi:MAG TPA: glucans biosynthesis glucosyltransferase MdoH [Burkholderiaceae bacterium]|nr:glucans biosynthesis glucosyltransferase MdoH [Burkholderiaceae bacterium]